MAIAHRAPRGIRNKNPGNIERNHIHWRGMSEDQSNDERFVVFDDPVMGIRAMARVLLVYHRLRKAKDGSAIDTVSEVIDRWAPHTENNSSVYAARVREAMHVESGEKIDLEDPGTLGEIVDAIIYHENGMNPYMYWDIEEGVRLAMET